MRQQLHPLDREPAACLRAAERAWLRWIAGVARGPLAALPHLGDERERWPDHFRGAVHEIAARIVLAGVRERLAAGHRSGDELVLELDPGRPLRLPLRRVGAFELHAPDLRPTRGDGPKIGPPLDPRLDDPLVLARALCRGAGLDAGERGRVLAELLDSIVNLAQARLAGSLRHAIAREPTRAADPRLVDPEHFVIDGHLWHPMTRTRLGLSRAAIVRCAPEQLARTDVRIVDLDAAIAQVAGEWAEVSARWFGAPAPGFVRVPIHPEAPANLARRFPDLLARGSIRPVAAPPVVCRSLLSLRTVALPHAGESPWHLKLACPIHTTSTRRQVSPMSVHNGPVVSALIAAIQRRDPDTRPLVLLPERAGAGLDPQAVEAAGELGAILRALPHGGSSGHAWVCAAIAEPWPGDPAGALVLERACAGYPGGRRERLEALIDDWLALLVPPALKLFSVHGIALELHLQNTLAHVVEGRLKAIWVRDLGGIRVYAPRLRAQPGPTPSFAPDSFIVTEDLDEARGKLEHTLFHAHLTHLFATAASLGVDEAACWAKLRALVSDCCARTAADPSLSEDQRRGVALDRAAMLQPRVRAKALLTMRLHRRSSDYDYTWVDNELA